MKTNIGKQYITNRALNSTRWRTRYSFSTAENISNKHLHLEDCSEPKVASSPAETVSGHNRINFDAALILLKREACARRCHESPRSNRRQTSKQSGVGRSSDLGGISPESIDHLRPPHHETRQNEAQSTDRGCLCHPDPGGSASESGGVSVPSTHS